MTSEEITEIVRYTLYTAIELATPFLLVAMILGALIAFLGAATQIHEITLSFVPKMLAIAFMLVILFPWMLKIMTKFTNHLLIDQWIKMIH